MGKLGSNRRSFSLTRTPPVLFPTAFQARRGEVEIFEPYEENLPLEAGFYTFVIDERGRFRVKRGNTSSHSSFTRCDPVGGAGYFRINRAGSVAEVFCVSLDYGMLVTDEDHPTVSFIIESFRNHHALELSPLAVFRFKNERYGSFFLSIDREAIGDLTNRLELLEREGQGLEDRPPFGAEEIAAFGVYVPLAPPRLYSMHRDQAIIALESDEEGFEFGPPKGRYSPDQPRLTSGKKAFIIDPDGWLIVGHGHHLLSGGGDVAAAGQIEIEIEPSGLVAEIKLNFSGHYRPPLDGTYARYTYRVLAGHPLITLSPDCQIKGRIFDAVNVASRQLRFGASELRSDDPELDELIEMASP